MNTYQFDAFVHKTPLPFNISATDLINEANAIVHATVDVCDRIVANVTVEEANFQNTIIPFVEDENSRSERENFIRFHASTSPSKDVRDASQKAASILNDAETDTFSRIDLFILVESLIGKTQTGSIPLDDESRHYLSKLHQSFINNGCGIPSKESRNTFVRQKKRITDLARQCRENLKDEETGLWLTADELQGVSESLIGKLKVGEGEHSGCLWLPTRAPFSSPAISEATIETTRKKIYYAVMNRVPQNVPLLRELTLLRDETARMLGWRNHFDFRTSQKMVQSPDVVYKLMSEIREGIAPVARQLAATSLAFKRDEAQARGEAIDDLKLFFWDRQYFQKKIDEKKLLEDLSRAEKLHTPPKSMDMKMAEYFELHTTLKKLLEMYEQLFGVKLVPVSKETILKNNYTWHEDVQMFSAWNMDNSEKPEFLGYSYFDLHPREGKFTHAGHYTLQRSYQRLDGSCHYPSSCLVMNYIKPTDKPTLLTFREVKMLFHELGHMYHSILSRTRYAKLHSVDNDFLETPSMMIEQLFWNARVIQNVSYHYSHVSSAMRDVWMSSLPENERTEGVEIPIQLSENQSIALAESNFNQNMPMAIDLLFFSTYDILIHSPKSHEELVATDLCKLFNKTRSDIYSTHGGEADGDGWDYAQGQTTFRGIIGKNDAGYYGYTLGRLFGLNIFQAGFSDDDPLNKENGRRYRDMVLCKGGTQPEMKTLTDYLGHEPKTDLYLQYIGGRH